MIVPLPGSLEHRIFADTYSPRAQGENILNLAVIFGFLIGIHNQQSNGSPRGFTLKDPR